MRNRFSPTSITIAVATSMVLSGAGFFSVSAQKSKSLDVTSEDLTLQSIDPEKSQTPEFQRKLKLLKEAAEKFKSSLSGRAATLAKAEEPLLASEFPNSKSNLPVKKSEIKEIRGFPAEWEGRWSGPAIVESMTFSKALQQSQPQAVASATGLMHPGRIGYCQLTFEANADFGKLQRYPQVLFRISVEEAKFAPGTKVGTTSFIGTASARNVALSDGSFKSSEGIFSHLHQLKKASVEQDSGEKALTIRRGRQISSSLRENAIFYEIIAPDQMYIYIAQINYLGNGDFESKLLMHGILKRKHDNA